MSNKVEQVGLIIMSSVLRKGKFIRFEEPVRLAGCQINYNLTVGAYTYIRGGRISGLRSIGRFCSFAPGLTIGDGQHPLNYLSTHPFQYKGAVFPGAEYEDFVTTTKIERQSNLGTIGSDVWIGANVTIMRGVNIGHGAVIGAGSIVTKDVSPYAIVAGVPAKVLRFRFPPETIKRLLDIKWWDYSLKSLEGIVFDDIDLALEELERRRAAGLLIPRKSNWMKYQDGRIIPDKIQPVDESSQELKGSSSDGLGAGI